MPAKFEHEALFDGLLLRLAMRLSTETQFTHMNID